MSRWREYTGREEREEREADWGGIYGSEGNTRGGDGSGGNVREGKRERCVRREEREGKGAELKRSK